MMSLGLFFGAEYFESYRDLERKTSIDLDDEENSRNCADHASHKRENWWYLLDWSVVNERICRFRHIQRYKDALPVGLERVINSQRLNDTASILLYIFEGPDAIVSNNGIVSKIDESFGAQSITKDNVALVLEVVAFVFLLIGVDDGVDVVES